MWVCVSVFKGNQKCVPGGVVRVNTSCPAHIENTTDTLLQLTHIHPTQSSHYKLSSERESESKGGGEKRMLITGAKY